MAETSIRIDADSLLANDPPASTVPLFALEQITLTYGPERFSLHSAPIEIPHGCGIVFRGWALPPHLRHAAVDVDVLIDDTVIGRSTYGFDRIAVARPYRNAKLRACGYAITIPHHALDVGSHAFVLRVRDERGRYEVPCLQAVVSSDIRVSSKRRVAGRFRIDVARVANDPVRLDGVLVRGYHGVVTGTIRDTRGGMRPSSVLLVAESADPAAAIVSAVAEGEAFAFRAFFATDEMMPAGPRHLRFVVVSSDGLEFEEFGPYVVPVVETSEIFPAVSSPKIEIPAHLAWVSGEHATEEALPDERIRSFSRDDVAFVRGWIVDPINAFKCGEIDVFFSDEHAVFMSPNQYRPDVAERLGMAGAAFCGFVGVIPMARFEPGRHVGRLRAKSRDGKHLFVSDAALAFEVR